MKLSDLGQPLALLPGFFLLFAFGLDFWQILIIFASESVHVLLADFRTLACDQSIYEVLGRLSGLLGTRVFLILSGRALLLLWFFGLLAVDRVLVVELMAFREWHMGLFGSFILEIFFSQKSVVLD